MEARSTLLLSRESTTVLCKKHRMLSAYYMDHHEMFCSLLKSAAFPCSLSS
jgi:hypothetical protein